MKRLKKIVDPSWLAVWLLWAGVLGLPGCETVINLETGALCSDGKDNDADEKIDCADPDCSDFLICSRRDSGARTDGVSDSLPLDMELRPDMEPKPDRSSSSYLQLCEQVGQPCPDGKTTCIINTATSQGYCSLPCTQGEICAVGPADQAYATCSFNFNQQWYCLFYCQYGNKTYLCPSGFDCVTTSNPGFKICDP